MRHFSDTQLIFSVLPAFPFKSPSQKKVLGTLPDLAEEIFLRRYEFTVTSLISNAILMILRVKVGGLVPRG